MLFKQVSWVRHRDTHPLTVGLFTYTPDPRFSAIHRSSSEDWVLEIRDTKLSDEGTLKFSTTTRNAEVCVSSLCLSLPLSTFLYDCHYFRQSALVRACVCASCCCMAKVRTDGQKVNFGRKKGGAKARTERTSWSCCVAFFITYSKHYIL